MQPAKNGDEIRHMENLDPKLKEALAQVADQASLSEKNWIARDVRQEMQDIKAGADKSVIENDGRALARHVMKVVYQSDDPQKFSTQVAVITGLGDRDANEYLASLKAAKQDLAGPSGQNRSGPEARQERAVYAAADTKSHTIEGVLQTAIEAHVGESLTPPKSPVGRAAGAETRRA